MANPFQFRNLWLLLLFATSMIWAQGSPNVTLLAHINQYPGPGYNDCWGYIDANGREYALLGVQSGTSILDITDTDNVVEVAFIGNPSGNSLWKDIKTYQTYAYVVNETGGGMQIIDLSDLPNSATLAATYTGFSTSHNIFIDEANGILYAEGSASQPVRVLSLANPVAPQQIATFGIECHDIFVRNNIAFIAEGYSGSVGIYDVSNPANPTLIVRHPIPVAGYVHNVWTTEDNHYMMTTEETPGKTVKYWDISNFTQITLMDTYLGPNGLAHNAHIKGNYSYLSHYQSGLRIVNISDPTNIFEEGFYDTQDAWGAWPFFHSGKVLISDIDDGLYVVFFQGAADGDPLDPNPPQDVTAYSDFTTPTSINLTWTDPTSTLGGDTLNAADFTIEIKRDDVAIASVPGGTENFTDTGLNDGQEYTYTLFAKIIATDSTSRDVSVSWFAGGSPVPAPPANLQCAADNSQATLTWQDPTTQSDGTPLDDLSSIAVYRDGSLIANVAPGTQSYVDTPPPGFTYTYTVTAMDNETPPNESSPSNAVECFVGDTPPFLVWVGPNAAGASAASGDSLFEAIVANGEGAFLTNNLFEFGNDLSPYQAIFVVLGVFSDNHVLTDPEGSALATYLQNGGRIYLEGGDCFNYDPDVLNATNIRPWFSLNDGPDGSGDVFGINGLNDLSAFSFAYNGSNSFMDELQPISSIPIWQNNSNSDISGVFYDGFGSGKAIGVVPSFGGLVNSGLAPNTQPHILETVPPLSYLPPDVPRPRPERTEHHPFHKRAAYYPELKAQRKQAAELFEYTAAGIHIMANNKVELMAAYLSLLGYSAAPQITLSDSAFTDTLQIGGNITETLTISNSGGPLAPDLTFSIVENPDQGWLTVSPLADTVAAGQSVDVNLALNAANLSEGTYSTTLEISSNDSNHPFQTVSVQLVVEPTTGIDGAGVPLTYAVSPNYPNPFNPSTTITYQVPEAASVRLEVYNLLGQRVRTLVKGVVQPGQYKAVWNGRNDNGVPVGSGVYLYRFVASGVSGNGSTLVKTYKMILLK